MRSTTRDSGQLLSFTLAFCGLSYELVLAQSLSVLLGNSVAQYALTIGLFLAGMGAGSAQATKTPGGSEMRVLADLQVVLAALVPVAFVALWWIAPQAAWWVAAPLAYTLAFAVGALTGMELPLLIQSSTRGPARLLALDYAGMLLACAAFPLYLLPHWGVFKTLFSVALVNALAALLLDLREPRRRLVAILLNAILLTLILNEGNLLQWLSQNFIRAAL